MRSFAIPLSVIIALAAAALCGPAYAGDTQIYRTVDAQGNVIYTDKTSSANTQQTTVHYHEPSAEDLKDLEQQRKALQATETQRLQEAVNSNSARAQQEKQQQALQARCESARSHFNATKDAGRLYQQNAQGDRVYLTDQEAVATRIQARQAMIDVCGS
jgi:ATPase subunit of ABC transporter with duplicated ATPase domains